MVKRTLTRLARHRWQSLLGRPTLGILAMIKLKDWRCDKCHDGDQRSKKRETRKEKDKDG